MEKLTEQVLNNFINSEEQSISIEMMPLHDISNLMQKCGLSDCNEYDSN